MPISWTKLPFPARNRQEFSQGLTDWLGRVFYDVLPEQGYEVREEQIYTAFRMARALTDGRTLMAEAGPGTGKTFAYLLPAVCHARFTGKPVIVASASGVLQEQLANPDGDIQTLSRILDLGIDARVAKDPTEYICELRIDQEFAGEPPAGWEALQDWARHTKTGARSEVPDVSDELWSHIAYDPSMECDTCRLRSTCHMMAARRHYRAAADLVVCDHRLFAQDLLTRQDLLEGRQIPRLPAYSAVVLDEGHHLPDTWQRVQGHEIIASRLNSTLQLVEDYANWPGAGRPEAVDRAVMFAQRATHRFLRQVVEANPGEGKRPVPRDEAAMEVAKLLERRVNEVIEELVTEEAMHQGDEAEVMIRAYQSRLEDLMSALIRFQSEKVVTWVEGEHLWAVPRQPVTLFGPERLTAGTPVIFSSATLEPEYLARVLRLTDYDAAQVGVPFDLGEQALVYMPGAPGGDRDEVAATLAVVQAMQGRTLVLLTSLAAVARYKQALTPLKLPWTLLFEGDGERGAMLEQFRTDRSSVLFGATFWEGVDVPGESLSCVVIPKLPFPAHDPLIEERRAQAEAAGEEPFAAVDLPEMLLKLKQGMGRLIRTTQDRGVLALLDRSFLEEPWANAVMATLPEDAERTDDLKRVARWLS